MINNQILKDRWFVWTLASIIIVGSSLLGYMEYSKTEMDTESVENEINLLHQKFLSSRNEISNRQTYRNEEYGFEFQYGPFHRLYEEIGTVAGIKDAKLKVALADRESSPYFFIITARTKSKESLINEYVNSNYIENVSIQEDLFGGIDGAKISYHTLCLDPPSPPCGQNEITYIVQRGINVYEISFSEWSKEIYNFNQILSTFRFSK